jgi:hypothetical protein
MTDYNHDPIIPRVGLSTALAAATAMANEMLWTSDTFRLYVEQGGAKKLVGEADFLKVVGTEQLKVWTYTHTITGAEVTATHFHHTITAVTLAKVRGVSVVVSEGGAVYSHSSGLFTNYYIASTTSVTVDLDTAAEGSIVSITIIEAV